LRATPTAVKRAILRIPEAPVKRARRPYPCRCLWRASVEHMTRTTPLRRI